MAATVTPLRKVEPNTLTFDKKGRHVEATFEVAPEKQKHRKCITCSGPVHRSWRTGILHSRCFFCRYLVMLYGPSIKVERG